MSFFRLRLLNTFLLFCAGLLLGFILKEKFYPPAAPAEPAPYKPVYAAPPRQPKPAADDEELTDEPYLAQDEEARAPERAAPPAVTPAAERPQAVIEPVQPAAARKTGVLRGEEENFFAKPAQYEGRDLEMELQMITARRAGQAWRLNLVYSGAGKRMDYLYIDDAELLGDKPDLRIGYVYRVRFSCGRGKADAGNTLVNLTPTGAKADWATGLSAVE